MKHLLVIALLLASLRATAQLPNGSITPDFTLTDYYGTTHQLYSYLDAGKTVFVEIFAAHCPTCWAYHQTHRLRNLYEQYGPDGSDELMVLALEHDQWNGANEFMGIGPPWVTAGDWLTGTPYPIFDVEDPDRRVFTDYNVTFYPAIYRVCPDRIVQQVFTSQTEEQLRQMVQECQAEVSVAEVPRPPDMRFDPLTRTLTIDGSTHVHGLEIIDGQGRIVQRWDGFASNIAQVAALPTGVYAFRLRTDLGQLVRRFVLE